MGKLGRGKEGIRAGWKNCPSGSHAMLVAIKKITPPTMIDDQICGHAFTAIARADFHALSVQGRHERENKQKDAVFLELRIFAEAYIIEIRDPCVLTGRKCSVLLNEKLLRHHFIVH